MPDVELPDLNKLALTIRTGAGVAVIVEGGQGDDEWIYGQWFSDRARRVTFHGRDGWAKVVEAVEKLGELCRRTAVFGILDRDFADDDELRAQSDTGSEGAVFRTPRYDIESYLLTPDCWQATIADIWDRSGGPPEGWRTARDVEARIAEHYQACLPVAAYNYTIHVAYESFRDAMNGLPAKRIGYLGDPKATKDRGQVIERLNKLAKDTGIPLDLGAIFAEHLAGLERLDMATWRAQVAGKIVLAQLHQCLPRKPGTGRYDKDLYVQLYLKQCPDPPPEIVAIVDRIERIVGRAAGGASPSVTP